MHKILLAVLGISNALTAANSSKTCSSHCLGPTITQGNASVRPYTPCNGDVSLTASGFYWNAHQDGMEYAIDNGVMAPAQGGDLGLAEKLNDLVDSRYKTPNFGWDFGFKIGLAYITPSDGWDMGVQWTWYQGKANDHIEAKLSDNHSLLPLWSAFCSATGSILYATDIQTEWKPQLNLIDGEIGREYWVSKYLTLRPFTGLRVAFIYQDFNIQHKGGSWSAFSEPFLEQLAYHDEVKLKNHFKGMGVRSGLNSLWNVSSGFGIYGNLAVSIVYGKFSVAADETIRAASAPYAKTKILETKESFRASRAILDTGLGVQWHTLFCKCQYGLTLQLGWEQHLFLHQNQLWKVDRVGGVQENLPNNRGENVYSKSRGTLDTQGWTLSVQLDF